MKFVGDNYGLQWNNGQVDAIYIECKKHNADREISSLQEFRANEAAELQKIPLSICIQRSDPELSLGESKFQSLGHDWIRHELGEFSQPPDAAPTVWMTFAFDCARLEVELSNPAFDHLHHELHAFGRATEPKCFSGHVLGHFFLQHGTKLIEGSDKQRSAFLNKMLAVYSDGTALFHFIVGSDDPENLSWAF